MAIDTYLKLRSAIEGVSKRTDALSHIDNFIGLAESDMWRDLKLREMESRAIATTSTTSRFIALPDDFLKMRKVTLQSGGVFYDLIFSTPESMGIQSTGRPREFSITSQIEFDRIPDAAYTIEAQYYKKLTDLDATNSTNAVLTNSPSLYLYGALFHYAQWAHDDRMLGQYSQLFNDEIRKANKDARRGRFGPAPAMRVEGSTP